MCVILEYAVRVGELKAELDLRKIDYANMFEKEELARCLADARADGRADPSIVDDFNRQNMERTFNEEESVAPDEPEFEAAAQAVASDGGLPGGMSPDRLQALMQDPELMAYLRNPRMQEIMKKVMQGGPEAAKDDLTDPEVQKMLQKISALTGGA